MKLDPHFEDFARDCIQLAREQKSVYLRSRLLALAREWIHAAMHHRRPSFWGGEQDAGHRPPPWSRADLEDLQYYLDYGNTLADAASMLCRDEEEVRKKASELGLVEHLDNRVGATPQIARR